MRDTLQKDRINAKIPMEDADGIRHEMMLPEAFTGQSVSVTDIILWTKELYRQMYLGNIIRTSLLFHDEIQTAGNYETVRMIEQAVKNDILRHKEGVIG